MRNRSAYTWFATALALVLALAACQPAAAPTPTPAAKATQSPTKAPGAAAVPTTVPPSAPTPSAPPKPIQLEVFDTTGYLNPMSLIWDFTFLKPQFYKDQGLEVQRTVIEMGLAPAAVQGGRAPIVAGSGIASVVTAWKGGADKIKTIAMYADQAIYDLIAQPQYKKVEDLKGKVLGVPSMASAASQTAQSILARHGLRYPGDYDLVLVGTTGGRYEALKAGKLDGTAEYAPNNYRAQEEGFTVLAKSKDYLPNYGIGTIIANTDWADKNRETVVRLMKAYLKSGQWLKDPKNKSEATADIAREMKIKPEWAERIYKDFVEGDLLAFNGFLPKEGALGNMEDLIRLGEFTKANVPEPGRFFEWSYLIQAHKDLGLTPPTPY